MGVWEKHQHNCEVVLEREAALAACQPFVCEVYDCGSTASPSHLVKVDEEGVPVYRSLCPKHHDLWSRPRAHPEMTCAEERDALMAEWRWPGEAWWRD